MPRHTHTQKHRYRKVLGSHRGHTTGHQGSRASRSRELECILARVSGGLYIVRNNRYNI